MSPAPYYSPHRGGNRQPNRPTTSPTTAPIPYGFHPVDPTQTVLDTPIWRDGQSEEEYFSGELLLTLTALTPLIVGNQQYALDEKHSELHPQRLEDGRVLIPGSSLKGMLRHALADLLQAPMDKVAEHHYTYRPNLGFARHDPKREFRAAVVESVEGKGPTAKVRVRLLPKETQVVFVREEESKLLSAQPGELIKGRLNNLALDKKQGRSRLMRGGGCDLNHYLYHYSGGIDGEGMFARAFNERGGVYRYTLVEADDVKRAEPLDLPQEIISAYYRTQEILADEHIGHLAPGHPLKSKLDIQAVHKKIKVNAELRPHQIIYLEVEYTGTPTHKGKKITSMGHHFQYRWAYTSSVCRKNRLLDGVGQLRPELAPHSEEVADPQGAPKRLSGARLLFGYALDGRRPEHTGLARGNFTRLAGRISCNTAIEAPGDKTPNERFIDRGEPVQLRVLGMPRPSAVEFYLRQDRLPGELRTYGDQLDDPGAALAGRKYYRHQPDAAKGRIYEAENNNTIDRERGTRVRFLSREGSTFRFTLRFDSLRSWELGALLAALEPKRLAEHPSLSLFNGVSYAHKLGYGKPLGLGSVRLDIDAARWYCRDDWAWQIWRRDSDTEWALGRQAIAHLYDKLQSTWKNKTSQQVKTWLKARQWKKSGQARYPQAEDRNGNSSIYHFHTELRRNHAIARRSAQPREYFSALKSLLDKD